MKFPLLKGGKWQYFFWGVAATAFFYTLILPEIRKHHSFGFKSKDEPSDSDIQKYVTQHHIGNPKKDIYDVEGPYTSGKHKGDIEITDLGPQPTTSPPHKRKQTDAYGGIPESQCCAYLQQLLSQQ